MKRFLKIGVILILFSTGKAQILFYQDTYKGGVTSDGRAYKGFDYLQADTIDFQLNIPIGSTIRKAFLFSYSGLWDTDSSVNTQATPLILDFNGSTVTFDNSSRVTNYFYCDYSPNTTISWIVASDVTAAVQASNNKVIVPCQTCLQVNDPNRVFVYDGFLLVVTYNDPSMPVVNPAIFLNNKTYSQYMGWALAGLNPINSVNDVALSIYNTNPALDSMSYTVQSSAGSFYLGSIGLHVWSFPPDSVYHDCPGSFFYENNVLYGLSDDTPDQYIDSTDALANIKMYLLNSTTTFTLDYKGATMPGCVDMNTAFVLAYSSPCPDINNVPLQIHKICTAGGSVQLNPGGNPGAIYSWCPGSGLSDSTIANPVASLTASANYVLTITDSNGCHRTEQHKILVKSSPPIFDSLIIANPSCGLSTVGSMTVISGPTSQNPYSYNIGSGNQSSPIFTGLSPGSYPLTITDEAGCFTSSTFSISLIMPVINFSFTPSPACIGDPINFSNIGAQVNNVNWFYNDTLFASWFFATHTFTNSGSFAITLIGWRNQTQCSDTVTKTLLVKECPPDSITVVAPNVFTPNSDGINDTWQPLIYDLGYLISDFDVIIHDRWGIEVFNSSGMTSRGWDGHTTSGNECTEGTYYYVISYKASNGITLKMQSLKGFLQLIK